MNAPDPNPKLDPTKAWAFKTLDHDRQLSRCAFSPCGKYVAACGLEAGVQRWELESGNKTTLAGHQTWVSSLAFHPDRQRLFTADYRGVVHCWPYTADSPKPLWSIAEAHQGWARAVAVSPDGKLLVTAGNDLVVRVWSADDGKPVRELAGHERDVFTLAFHPDGRALVSGDLLGRVCHWDFAAGKLARTIDAGLLHTRGDDYEFTADVGGVRAMAFDDAGKLLACSGMTNVKGNTFCPGDPLVLVFDWASGQLKQQLKNKQKADGPFNTLRFLGDGTLVGHGEGSSGSALAFWKTDQSEPVHELNKGKSGYSVDLHPDGLQLAIVEYASNGPGGNGRHVKSHDEYVSNNGVLSVLKLFEKPEEAM